jgi:hypothetical protein
MASRVVRELGDRIDHLRRGGRDRIAYLPPIPSEALAYAIWVRTAAEAARDGAPLEGECPPGFRLEVLPAAPHLWLLSEEEDARRGAGVVILRRGRAASALVEAPHTFFDRGTLPIALTAFESCGARALVVNTVHRFRMPARSADVAHAELSFFLLAHEALLEAFPGLPCIQLHGFSEDRAPGASVILSAAGSGAAVPAKSLRAVVGEEVRVYPDEIRKLGGMTNVEARASRRAGAPFLHVEIARGLRDRLTADEDLARRFVHALMPAEKAGDR